MIEVTVLEAQHRLPELLDSVAAGENVTIVGNQEREYTLSIKHMPIAVSASWSGYPRAGCCEGLFVVPSDFKEPLEELKEYEG